MTREAILKVLPDLKKLQEAPLMTPSGDVIGWHANAVVIGDRIIGSGTHPDRAIARTIALAEAMERKIVFRLKNTPQKNEILLDEYPTTCGFAVGFDSEKTKQRALAEAVERWLRSQWIDSHFKIPELPSEQVVPQLSPTGRWMEEKFDQVFYYRISNSMEHDTGASIFHSAIVVGIKGGGAFVGSRTSLNEEGLWEHALVEAWRHLILFERSPDRSSPEMKPIVYFGTHQQDALSQISLAQRRNWPEPKLRMIQKVNTGQSGIYCFRAVCEDFQGWHGDNYKRFVY